MRSKDDKVTTFNSAIASLERIHALLLDCNTYKRECRFNGYNLAQLNYWRTTVYSLYDELSAKLVGDKKGSHEEIKNLFKRYKTLEPIVRYRRTPDGTVSVINPRTFNEYWSLTSNIERKLRTFADKKGMLIPDQDDDFFEPENW